MIRLIQRRLIIPRGDTGSFTIPAIGVNKVGSTAAFTIFDPMTRTRVFQKLINVDSDTLTISFTHEDTVNINPGRYFWDIKFYVNPVYEDENDKRELIGGDVIDSYYAGYDMPVCEIRETADNYLTADNDSKLLTSEQIDIVTSALNEIKANSIHLPKIEDGNWYLWDIEKNDYVDSGVSVSGTNVNDEDYQILSDYIYNLLPNKVGEYDNELHYIHITDAAPLRPETLRVYVGQQGTPSLEEPTSLTGYTTITINVSSLYEETYDFNLPFGQAPIYEGILNGITGLFTNYGDIITYDQIEDNGLTNTKGLYPFTLDKDIITMPTENGIIIKIPNSDVSEADGYSFVKNTADIISGEACSSHLECLEEYEETSNHFNIVDDYLCLYLAEIYTLEDAIDYFKQQAQAGTPLQIFIPYQEEVEIQLSNPKIVLGKGSNYVFSPAGRVQLIYQPDAGLIISDLLERIELLEENTLLSQK